MDEFPALAHLREAFAECQAAVQRLTVEQTAQGLALALELRAFFYMASAIAAHRRWEHAQAATLLQVLPAEVLSTILSQLEDCRDLARLAATCRLLWCDAPAAPSRLIGLVEAELRRRAEARRLDVGSSLPEGAASWVPYLLKRELCDVWRRHAPLAAGVHNSAFVDREGRLLTCGKVAALGHGSDVDRIGPPKLVPSMMDRRIVSISGSVFHCLALDAEGEVYSWGRGRSGVLGHGDENDRAVPSRIASLKLVESITAGDRSAAIDERGRLFTWGQARCNAYMHIHGDGGDIPTSLGYAIDPHTGIQSTPGRVDALSQDRVVGVALGIFFTLAVNDAGAVFSFGHGPLGALGHGSLESEVLPRRIEALAQTGRRFVAVAAGTSHALALTEGGELYGWGIWSGHGQAGAHHEAHTPKLVTTLIGVRIKLVYASACSSCAVTETGEIYTWGGNHRCRHLGHGGWDEQQLVPRRVERLSSVRVAAVALGVAHMLVADEDGGAWACGSCLGLDESGVFQSDDVREPTLIPTLRVRTRY